MNAREQILARLNQANATPLTAQPDVAGWYGSRQRGEDLPQRTARLRAALAAMRAEVHDVTPDNWAEVLMELATAKGLRQVLVGTDTPHGDELLARQTNGIEVMAYTQPIDTWRDLLFDGIDAALTLARGAVADPGSLVLWPSPSEPRDRKSVV